MRRTTLVLSGILLLGFLVRVEAVRWNWFMHTDIAGEATVSASFHRTGRLLTFNMPSFADPAGFVLPVTDAGEPLMHHGPLWPMLGAALTAVRGGQPTIPDAYLSLRILSLLSGMLIVFLSFLVASRVLDDTAGLAAAAWTAASYILIDYSGNGAFYSLHAVIYLLWILVALAPSSFRRTLLLGALAGIGYLVNFQCIILVPSGLIVLLTSQTRPWKRLLLHMSLLVGVWIVIAAPWLVRNAILFGDPFYSHTWQMQYVYTKAGLSSPTGGLIRPGFQDRVDILAGILRVWLPDNLYYVARKLFILAPFAFFLFSFGLVDLLFSPKRLRRIAPILVLLTLHLVIFASWPIWKFRFFVPLLPLVFILALEELWHLPLRSTWRHVCIGATSCALIVLSILMYRATPTHTTYYDGALTQDAYHGSEEMGYLRTFHLLPPSYAH